MILIDALHGLLIDQFIYLIMSFIRTTSLLYFIHLHSLQLLDIVFKPAILIPNGHECSWRSQQMMGTMIGKSIQGWLWSAFTLISHANKTIIKIRGRRNVCYVGGKQNCADRAVDYTGSCSKRLHCHHLHSRFWNDLWFVSFLTKYQKLEKVMFPRVENFRKPPICAEWKRHRTLGIRTCKQNNASMTHKTPSKFSSQKCLDLHYIYNDACVHIFTSCFAHIYEVFEA